MKYVKPDARSTLMLTIFFLTLTECTDALSEESCNGVVKGKPELATVVSVNGGGRLNSTRGEMRGGSKIYFGDSIQLGNKGEAVITLKDGTPATMSPGSRLNFDCGMYLFLFGDGSVQEAASEMMKDFFLSVQPEPKRKKTPVAIIGVRG